MTLTRRMKRRRLPFVARLRYRHAATLLAAWSVLVGCDVVRPGYADNGIRRPGALTAIKDSGERALSAAGALLVLLARQRVPLPTTPPDPEPPPSSTTFEGATLPFTFEGGQLEWDPDTETAVGTVFNDAYLLVGSPRYEAAKTAGDATIITNTGSTGYTELVTALAAEATRDRDWIIVTPTGQLTGEANFVLPNKTTNDEHITWVVTQKVYDGTFPRTYGQRIRDADKPDCTVITSRNGQFVLSSTADARCRRYVFAGLWQQPTDNASPRTSWGAFFQAGSLWQVNTSTVEQIAGTVYRFGISTFGVFALPEGAQVSYWHPHDPTEYFGTVAAAYSGGSTIDVDIGGNPTPRVGGTGSGQRIFPASVTPVGGDVYDITFNSSSTTPTATFAGRTVAWENVAEETWYRGWVEEDFTQGTNPQTLRINTAGNPPPQVNASNAVRLGRGTMAYFGPDASRRTWAGHPREFVWQWHRVGSRDKTSSSGLMANGMYMNVMANALHDSRLEDCVQSGGEPKAYLTVSGRFHKFLNTGLQAESICFLAGGGTPFRPDSGEFDPQDFEFRRIHFHKRVRWWYNDPVTQASKINHEYKNGKRWYHEACVMENGQNGATSTGNGLVFQSETQTGGQNTYQNNGEDGIFVHCQIRRCMNGVNIGGRGATTEGLRYPSRLVLYNVDMSRTAIRSGNPRMSGAGGSTAYTIGLFRPNRDIVFRKVTTDGFDASGSIGNGFMFFDTNPANLPTALLRSGTKIRDCVIQAGRGREFNTAAGGQTVWEEGHLNGASGFTVEGTVFYGSGTSIPSPFTGPNTHTAEIESLFTDYAAGDLRPATGSLILTAGVGGTRAGVDYDKLDAMLSGVRDTDWIDDDATYEANL